MTALRRVPPADVARPAFACDAGTLAEAARLLDEVRTRGDAGLRRLAQELDGLAPGAPLVLGRDDLRAARAGLDREARALLERTAARIDRFARAQRASLREVTLPLPGGRCGHRIAPVEAAGCYAPGGRYPLPSSVLMTAVTARAAGVARVVVASPRPTPLTLAAAAIADADALLCAGGAQAVAALAFGTESVSPVDVLVGPGNRWVTAAKQLVVGRVGIDGLAGPSELVVLADGGADPERVAADLLAQAEHDEDAAPTLVTTCAALAEAVEGALARQLAQLPTRATAAAALRRQGRCVVCRDLDEAIAVCDRLAPEHLQVLTADPAQVGARCGHWGGLFLGAGTAEVAGDYGAGPNHVLPTGGTARFTGGLSVLAFLRVRTWMQLDDAGGARELYADAAALSALEGLDAHRRAAVLRLE